SNDSTRMEQECNKDGRTGDCFAMTDLVMPEPPVTAVTKSRAKKGDDTEHNQN
ncbi:hypothetical protein PSTT_12584, partial [Puccinia striiformis]